MKIVLPLNQVCQSLPVAPVLMIFGVKNSKDSFTGGDLGK
jgi:hypothetical protein